MTPDGVGRDATERMPSLVDVAYAEPVGRAHLLDLHLPAAGGPNHPLIVWTGGSAFLADNGKDSAGRIAEVFNPLGYAVAGVSVRSSTQAVFPAQVDDMRSAIGWLRANAGAHGVDPDRIVVMGDSSGGWAAAMATLTVEGVRAGVAFYPPTDFLRMDEQMLPGACDDFNTMMGLTGCHNDPLSPESRLIGGPIQDNAEAVARANPATYVRGDSPPLLLVHGGADPLVPIGQSELLFRALRAAGAPAEFYPVPDAGHDLDEVLAGPGAPTWETVEAFIRAAW